MDVHQNARLTPKGREDMVRAVVEDGLTRAEAARRFNTTAKTVAKWIQRFRKLGVEGLRDRLEHEQNILAAELERLTQQNERLDHIITVLRRAQFGRSSERISDEQMALALEDVETVFGVEDTAAEKTSEIVKRQGIAGRRANRGHLPAHLLREEIVIEPEAKACPCCGGALHVIGEDRSERLDKIPAKLRVIVTRRPKYACRSCTDGVVQAPAPNRLIEGGLPTEALVADVLVSKYADHLPLYRRSQILNGSLLVLTIDGDTWTFRYIEPRSGLIEEGVTRGTLLFSGRTDGQRLLGTAYRFSKRCGPIAYAVEGDFAPDGTLTLNGEGVSGLDRGCDVTQTTNYTLVFQQL